MKTKQTGKIDFATILFFLAMVLMLGGGQLIAFAVRSFRVSPDLSVFGVIAGALLLGIGARVFWRVIVEGFDI